MLLSKRLSVGHLIDLCRSMRYSLGSGLLLHDVMQLLAVKGTRPVRPVAERIVQDLKSGWGLQEALKKNEGAFPPLFLAIATIGEESGHLPEVLGELENYYLMQQELQRNFRSEIRWPVFQLGAAILVITGLIYILGVIVIVKGATLQVIDPLGLGLVGARGALTFLGLCIATALLLVLAFWAGRRFLRRRAAVERFILRTPLVGPCVRAIAMTRFCVALHLMLETNVAIIKSFRLAFAATDNAAFMAALPRAEQSLRQGNSITASLQTCGVFPEKFLSAAAVAEEAGRLPDVLRHQAKEFDDESRRRLTLLNQIASYLVWVLVAFVIIVAIFRIFTITYLGVIQKVLPK